jgi:hypothetical protein
MRKAVEVSGNKEVGPKTNEITAVCRKLHNEHHHNLYMTPNFRNDQIKEDDMGGACSTQGIKMRTKIWLESLKARDHS